MAHSTNTHRFRSAVNHADTYALTDTNLSSTQGSRAYRLASLSLLPSPPEGVRDRVSRMLGKSFYQADSEYAEEKNELSEWAPSPLLIDSGRLLISSGHRRQTPVRPQ